MQLAELVLAFRGPVRWDKDGSAWVFCPGHLDGQKSNRQSLHFSPKPDGGLLGHCFAGCDLETLLAQVGLELKALAPPAPAPLPPARRLVRSTDYDYQSEAGVVLFRVVRREYSDGAKSFPQCRPDGHGGWIWKLGDVRRVLYRLPELKAALKTSPLGRGWLVLVEGEKCADAVRALGIPATTASGGAGKWGLGGRAYFEQLVEGALAQGLVLCPDQDAPGWAHLREVLEAGLAFKGLDFKWLALPDLPPKGDVVDWIQAGGTREAFVGLVAALPLTTDPHTIKDPTPGEIGPLAPEAARTDDLAGALEDPASHLTDLGNARQIVLRRGLDLRYTKYSGWRIWDTRRFAADDDGVMARIAKEAILVRYAEAPEVEPRARKRLLEHLIRSEASGRLEAATHLAASELEIATTDTKYDADPWAFNVLNGTLDLRSGVLRPHRRSDLITKVAPVTFDAAATAPRFERFLDEVLPTRAIRTFLQKAVGYALTGDTREQCYFILFGEGENGKSTFIEALRNLFGDYADKASAETFLARRSTANLSTALGELAKLRGVRLALVSENDPGRELAEGLVKDATGGEPIGARLLYREPFHYVPQFKLFLSTNHKPVIRSQDWGTWRRIRAVPFEVRIANRMRDKLLGGKLDAERAGIFNWALEGCQLWWREGLDPPPEIEQATEEYREEEDQIADFLGEECELGRDYTTTSSALYRAYVEWVKAAGERQLSKRHLGLLLKAHGFKHDKGGHGRRLWRGLKVKIEALGSAAPERDASGDRLY